MFVGFIWDIIIRYQCYQYTSKKRIIIYIYTSIGEYWLLIFATEKNRFQQIRLTWVVIWRDGYSRYSRGRKVLTIIIGSDCSMQWSRFHRDAQRKTQKLAGGLTPILMSNIFGGWFPMVWIAEWAQIIHLDSIRTMTAFGRVVPRHTCGRIEQRPQGPEMSRVWFLLLEMPKSVSLKILEFYGYK